MGGGWLLSHNCQSVSRSGFDEQLFDSQQIQKKPLLLSRLRDRIAESLQGRYGVKSL